MKRSVTRTLAFVALSALFTVGATVGFAGTPDVNGLFFGDGDYTNYWYYGENPGRGTLWYRLEGSMLYVAVVVSNTVNDNVFSDDKAYTGTAGWNAKHGFKALEQSDHMRIQVTCGNTVWDWNHGYVYKNPDTNATERWLSGPGDGSIGGGANIPDASKLVSRTSLEYNLNNSSWDYTMGSSDRLDWKSLDAVPAGGDNSVTNEPGYPIYSSAYDWEWPMVYEFSLDLSGCSGDFKLLVVSAHNSPSKDGEQDVPFDSEALDYGDAPDSYNTTLESDGARHQMTIGGPFLGDFVDVDTNGTPTVDALGDDVADGTDDEDGVVFLSALEPGSSAQVQITGTPGAKLDAWIDFNADGDFGDAGEQIASSWTLLAAVTTHTFSVPAGATEEQPPFARFRLSSYGGLGPDGVATNGEVEDYLVTASLGDYVWFDTNKDGIQDGNESGLQNVTVNLYDGSSNLVGTTTTDATGFYEFTGLNPGDYFVEFELLYSYKFSPQNVGGDDTIDSDADTTSGRTATTTLSVGENDPTWDAGMYQPSTLVTISSFGAELRDGQVVVQWVTSMESGAVGFYLQRLNPATGEYEAVNTGMILASLFSYEPQSYEVVDPAAVAGGTYSYRLVELENTGRHNTYGPYTVTVGRGSAAAVWRASVFTAAQLDDQGVSGDAADPDGDGHSNLQEFKAGTDPLNGGSVLKITSALRTGSRTIEIRWLSAGGKTYTVEKSTDPHSGFDTVAAGVTATPPENALADTLSGEGRMFYRIRVE